jgi:hypothetical protein
MQTTRNYFRDRVKEAPVLKAQALLLWTISRAFGPEEMEAWKAAAAVTGQLASAATDQVEHARKFVRYLALALFTALAAILIWAAGVASSWLGAPLFQNAGWPDRIAGHLLQLGGFSLLFMVIFGLDRIERSARHVRTLRMFGDGASYVAPFLAVMPSVAIYCGWMVAPKSRIVLALYDGSFMAGFVMIPVVLVAAMEAITKFWREERRIWDDPRLAFLKESLAGLDKIFPPVSSQGAMRNVVERLWQHNDYWSHLKSDLIDKFRETLSDPTAPNQNDNQAAESRWWLFRGQTISRKFPNPLFDAIADFLWIFHPKNPQRDEWGEAQHMANLASNIRGAARCLQVYGQRQRTGDPIQDNWQQRVCEERAAFLRSLQRGVFLPRGDTRVYLLSEFKKMLSLVLQHDWGSMPFIEMPNAPQLPLWYTAITKAKTILVGALPLAGIYALSDKLSALPATINASLWTGAVVWLVVNLLTLLDERVSEKFSAVKDLFSAFTPGKGKE